MSSATSPISDVPLSEAKIKGAGVLGFFQWWNASGERPLREMVHDLDPALREGFDEKHPVLGILSANWYPAEVIHAILDQMQGDRSDARMQELVRQGSHAMVSDHLTGIYRFLFLTFMNPDRYARSSQKLFRRYFSEGRLTKTIEAPSRHVAKLTGWLGHHPLLCDASMYGGECAYLHLGCEDVRVTKTSCVARGASECSWTTEWRA